MHGTSMFNTTMKFVAIEYVSVSFEKTLISQVQIG